MKRGDKITVVVRAYDFESHTGHAIDAEPTLTTRFHYCIVRNRAGGRVTYSEMRRHGNVGFLTGVTQTVAYSARGIEWARGWEGEEVEALKVAVALS